jgi:hypothetical protein
MPKLGVSSVDYSLAAVMMPFSEEAALDSVYGAIALGASTAGFNCKRVDELMVPSDITDDIEDLIRRAGAVVVDATGFNPNVMFEFGFACGCEKDVVIITSDDLTSLPFDFRQKRVIRYFKSEAGLQELSEKLGEFLKAVRAGYR